MKTIAIAFFALLSFSSISQIERIESTKLDSLIWKKINEYRISKGAKAFAVFEDSLMRDFCTRVAYRNIVKTWPTHSDSVGYWSNAECLYTFITSGKNALFVINEVHDLDYETLAEKTVQGWIHSPTHERAISRPEYNIATIVSIIIINPKTGELRLDATYHALDKGHTTYNDYVCQVTKKGNR
jgi:hypothetical protein